MSTPELRPTPPVLPYGTGPVVGFVAGALVSVVGGGYLSGLLAGTGPALPAGIYGVIPVVVGLFSNPSDPASAWPAGSQPGGPILTWLCIGIIAAACILLGAVVSAKNMARKASRRVRANGFADREALATVGIDEKSAVKKAKATRLSLSDVPVRRIEAAAETTRIGTLYDDKKQGVFLQYRDGVLVEGPTGSGKTWRMFYKAVVEAIGPVVATSTRGDLLRATWAERAAVGRVEVFDPDGLTVYPNKMQWSILDGCDDPEVAMRRAAALVQAMPMDGTSNSSYWNGKAAMLMRGYLYAAAVLDKDLVTLRVWAASRNVKPVHEVLSRDLPDWDADLSQALESKADSSDDMIGACTRLLEPLASPKLMRSLNVPLSESADLRSLITEGRNTVYLISEGGSASAAAMTTVLSAELYHVAKTHGLTQPDDKIDPPLRMVLDEMNNVAAIPNMPSLITDSGGRGIQIWAGVHSRLQNEQRWGHVAGQLLSNESPTRLYLTGLGDADELATISKGLGMRDEYMSASRMAGPRSVPVMAGSDIARMPADQALLRYREAKPIKLHVPSVWDVPVLAARVKANQKAFDEYCATGHEKS
ncbi:TraM recognition domain-containing protein [Rhodococcus ruber]|uniref:TraM recognition domain-containing protein n=1 Tax=Rhodococcus ruber TaxID=1830 RepID=A0ABT4MAZ2_9NOCA|nr:TraM recognition domain-containing protein [Rhodococcus ruber]MCZ4516901.1 TraM recognition domain-containing protein [Rhodococcus ruber]